MESLDELLERHALNGEMGNVLEVLQGDCFIVINSRGRCWDGANWTGSWTDAVQFRRPDPAYELCEQLAKEAEMISGVAGLVCYIQPGTPSSFVISPLPDLSQVDLRGFARSPEVCGTASFFSVPFRK